MRRPGKFMKKGESRTLTGLLEQRQNKRDTYGESLATMTRYQSRVDSVINPSFFSILFSILGITKLVILIRSTSKNNENLKLSIFFPFLMIMFFRFCTQCLLTASPNYRGMTYDKSRVFPQYRKYTQEVEDTERSLMSCDQNIFDYCHSASKKITREIAGLSEDQKDQLQSSFHKAKEIIINRHKKPSFVKYIGDCFSSHFITLSLMTCCLGAFLAAALVSCRKLERKEPSAYVVFNETIVGLVSAIVFLFGKAMLPNRTPSIPQKMKIKLKRIDKLIETMEQASSMPLPHPKQ